MAKLLGMYKPYKILNSKALHNFVSFNEFGNVPSKKHLPSIINDDFNVDLDEIKLSHRKLLSGIKFKRSLNEQMDKVYLSSSCNNSFKKTKTNLSICENCSTNMLLNNKIELNSLKDCLMRILREMEVLTTKTKHDLDEEHKKLNWKFAAMVIDRLCIILFAMATFVSTFTFAMNLFLTFD